MNKWIWGIALKNAVAIICWTFLACHFGKWWIALFGALFLTSVEWGRKTMTDIEAIEWLKQISDKYIHGGDEWFDEQRCRAIEYAIECIYKRNKWIPVSERLPDPFEDVLVYVGTEECVSMAYMTSHKEWCGIPIKSKVTHWMPLPEAPKEEDNGKE